MRFIIVILKDVMSLNLVNWKEKLQGIRFLSIDKEDPLFHNLPAFFTIVRKEFTDYIRSWRIIILLAVILLASVGSLYTSISSIAKNGASLTDEFTGNHYFFLELFTLSDGTLPSFLTFVGYLGPLLGIALGFDAINAERNRGTLSRLMAQPIPRDYVLNGKFFAALLLNAILFLTIGFFVIAMGILVLGLPPTMEEFFRIFIFLILCIVYIAFWLNVGILCSTIFKNPATSALCSIALWIFFSLFFSMVVQSIAQFLFKPEAFSSTTDVVTWQNTYLNFMRLNPYYLFSESTTILLSPTTRTVGVVTVEQAIGAIASPLPLSQSLLLIWPQLTALIAATLLCFAISYVIFMRQEIRTN